MNIDTKNEKDKPTTMQSCGRRYTPPQTLSVRLKNYQKILK
jgi:hypothetical protein